MKRTTSMTIIDLDLDDMELSDSHRDSVMKMVEETALPSWCNHKTCGFCNRGLRPSRDDIFMYRGNMAFCSPECRDQQMKHDERKEKCSIEDNLMEDRNHHQATTLQRPLPPQPPPFKLKN